jgi:hypothetical protein
MDWISVKDRLPSVQDTGNNYLAYTPDFNEAEYMVVMWFQRNNKSEGAWEGSGVGWITKHVTHWMPLPEPPNQNKS